MRVAEKLALSAKQGKIVIFREGLFVRFYNHSLMRWVAVGQPLKVSVRPMHCLQGACCYTGGMPEASWIVRYRQGGVSLPGGSARVTQWRETPWGYEGDVEGQEPDWEAFCNAHQPPLSAPAPLATSAHTPLPGIEEDLLMRLAQWDVWQAPLASTIELLETCRQVLCSHAPVSVKPHYRQ